MATPLELLRKNFYNDTIVDPVYATPDRKIAPIASDLNKFKSGVFIGARIAPESCKLIRQYVVENELDKMGAKILPNSELHFTIMYSKQAAVLDYPLSDPIEATAKLTECRYIGKALAFIAHSDWLRWRHKLTRTCGLASQYTGFIPHLSIAYDPPSGLPVAFLPRPNFCVKIISEYAEPLDAE